MSERDPIPDVPGIEHVIRALQAEGDATELLGRQAALTMFRAARHQPAATQPPHVQPVYGQPAFDPNSTRPLPGADQGAGRHPLVHQSPNAPAPGRWAPRSRRFRVVTGVAAALLATCVGLTAAAYARVLPDPAQNIAHSVLAPLGIPGASPAAPSATPPSQGSPGASTAGGNGASTGPGPSAGVSNPAATGGVSVSLAAARTRVPAGGPVAFTGRVSRNGRPARGARVRLLVHLSTDVGTWRVAALGVTREDGTVALVVLRVPVTATFRLAGTGKLADATSPAVTVTVTPRLFIRQPAVGVLVVMASPAAAGDTVTLLRLQAGTWVTAGTSRLSATREATFAVRPGVAYRVLLQATPMHGFALSGRVTAVGAATAVTGARVRPTLSAAPAPNQPRF